MSKRPGTQSDEDRALAELQRRRTATPAGGVPIGDFDRPQPTPPPVDPEELISKLWPLRHAGDAMTAMSNDIAVLKEKAAQLERLAGGLAELGETREEMREGFADLRGARGDNGKVGALKARVDALSSKAWWVFSAFVGGLGAATVKLVMIVRAFDAVESMAAHNTARIDTLQAQVLTLQSALLARHMPQPAEAPGKDSP